MDSDSLAASPRRESPEPLPEGPEGPELPPAGVSWDAPAGRATRPGILEAQEKLLTWPRFGVNIDISIVAVEKVPRLLLLCILDAVELRARGSKGEFATKKERR